MDKYTDNELFESEGLYSKQDSEGIELIEKAKRVIDFTLLCNKVCFKSYQADMTNEEAVCHDKCYKSMYSTLLYCQRRFIEENNLHKWSRAKPGIQAH